jgi:hypothetical protein
MIEQQCLADKILQELPEELAAATTFKVDEKERLCMFFSFKLAGPDFQVVLDVVKRYQGDFVNQKEDGRDVGFFMFPKPKPKEEVKPAADLVPPAAQAKEEKPLEALKQSSPMQILKARFCELCEDNGTDKCNFELCLRILGVFEAQSQTDVLEKINRSLDNVQRQLSQIQPVQAASSNNADARAPPAAVAPPSQKVERNTRPLEGHREGDVVWIYDENRGGERYEKALQKDNERSNDYFAIRRSILDAEAAGRKGIVLEGKWCWLSTERDFIGRKVAKQFPKGGRR